MSLPFEEEIYRCLTKNNALHAGTQGHFKYTVHLGWMLIWASFSWSLPKFIEKQILQPESFPVPACVRQETVKCWQRKTDCDWWATQTLQYIGPQIALHLISWHIFALRKRKMSFALTIEHLISHRSQLMNTDSGFTYAPKPSTFCGAYSTGNCSFIFPLSDVVHTP